MINHTPLCSEENIKTFNTSFHQNSGNSYNLLYHSVTLLYIFGIVIADKFSMVMEGHDDKAH